MIRSLRLMGLCWLLFLSTAFAGEVGHVTEATHEARIIRGDSVFVLEQGVALRREDVISTGRDGHAQLEMDDGSILELGPSSQIHLSEYLLDDQRQVEKAEVSLLTGWLRFLTAKLAPQRPYRFTTPTMIIGIRGTQGTIYAEEDSSSLSLSEGLVDLTELDDAGQTQFSSHMQAGEYVAHRRGQRLQLQKKAPDSFKNRLPARLKKQRARKLHLLKKRGVKLRLLHKVSVNDLKQAIRANPRIRDRLIRQFQQRFRDPTFRENFRKYIKGHPVIRDRLKNHPILKQKLKSRAVEKKRERQIHKRRELQYRQRKQ